MILRYVLCLFAFCLSSASFGQFQNVLISTLGLPNEPCIAINPKNPAQIVAGANNNYVYQSNDTGKTWQMSALSSTYGVWGDPVIVSDTMGRFYYFHLSAPSGTYQSPDWLDRIVCQYMDGINSTWSSGSYTGLNGNKDQDKEWVAFNPLTQNLYMTWTEFDGYGSTDSADSTRILFSMSADRGDSWSTPVRINEVSGDCIDEDNTVEGAVPCVGPNGAVYVAWTGPAGIRFDRSLDQGQTWLENDVLIDTTTGWDFTIPGLNRCNGLPFTACDRSNGPNHGNLYVQWSDQRNGTDNTDIFFSRSTDGGDTWSPALRVNTDANVVAHQFLGSMTVDQQTGYIYVLYYDRRNYTDNRTDVYLAFSKDGGLSFSDRRISDAPFTPFSSMFFGDYTYVAAEGNIIRPIWGETDGPFQSIWTALVDTTSLFAAPTQVSSVKLEGENTWPNPFYETTFISFKLRDEALVRLEVLDVFGRTVTTLVAGQKMQRGKYVYQFDPGSQALPEGMYFFHLVCDNEVKTRRIVYSR